MTFGIDPLYRLRWRFDYTNRPSRFGIWNNNGAKLLSDMACYQKTEGLSRAAIESESLVTQETECVCECEGWDFIEFRWIAAVAANPFAVGEMTVAGSIVGLELITREKRASATIDGKLVISERLEKDKLNLLDQYRK